MADKFKKGDMVWVSVPALDTHAQVYKQWDGRIGIVNTQSENDHTLYYIQFPLQEGGMKNPNLSYEEGWQYYDYELELIDESEYADGK